MATDDIRHYMIEYEGKSKTAKVTEEDIPTWTEFTGDEGHDGNQNSITQSRFRWVDDNKIGLGLELEKEVSYR